MIVILTALNLEHLAVRRLLSSLTRLDHPAGTVFEIGRPRGGGGLIALAVTGQGNTAAAVLAERAIATFRPRALIFAGVAGALRDDVALGDVVVATKVYAYHGGEALRDGFRPRPRSWDIPHELDQVARHVQRTGSWLDRLAPGRAMPFPRPAPAVHFRPIAAGEIVLNSRDDPLSGLLRGTYSDAAAIEMEGAGVAQAAHLNERLPMLTVRGISDLADGRKHDTDRQGWQPVAAAHAAAFAVAVATDLGAAGRDKEGERRIVRLRPEASQARLAVAGSPTTKPSPSASGVPPRQLPGQPGRLVGREPHLAWLDEILLRADDDHPKIAILTGMAGAGKTALAVRWAHGASDAFPAGQLYVDARGFGPDPPLNPLEILATFLRGIGQSEAAELGTVEERAARFRTAMSGRRALIVLDNVASVGQVRPLLPGAGASAVLITSRERLRGLVVQHAAQALEVGRLSARDAAALLREPGADRVDESERYQLATLAAERCAGLPLALRIAQDLVTTHPAGHLSALAGGFGGGDAALDLLDTGDDPYSAVRTVFSWSYRALPDPIATAYRLLGLHPGNTFGLHAVMALLNVPSAEAKARLRVLVNANLVTETRAGRFGMHDLMHEYALEVGRRFDPATARLAAIQRMFDQYLHTADRAGRMIMPHRYRPALDGAATVESNFDDRAGAALWFETELTNLVEICRLTEPGLDRRRWQLAYVLRDFFYLSKHLDSWLETHRLAVAGCKRLGDRRAEGLTRNNLGRALLEAGRLDAAAAQYRQAHELLEAAGDRNGVTDARVNLATILRRRGRYDEALRDLEAALDYYRSAELGRKIGITLRGIARTEVSLGRPDEAAQHATEALGVFVDLALDLDAAQSLSLLIDIHGQRADTSSAEAAGQRAIEFSRLAHSDFEEARALHRLGKVAAQAKQQDKARQLLTMALEIYARLGAQAAEAVRSELRDIGG
ncbi:MAG TPA: tetratricopeptide repeat protein [Streptosporangiaceae bacterium]|nr:tetratricopeptide repeat protein [Streptosporangiaceae bacterium]